MNHPIILTIDITLNEIQSNFHLFWTLIYTIIICSLYRSSTIYIYILVIIEAYIWVIKFKKNIVSNYSYITVYYYLLLIRNEVQFFKLFSIKTMCLINIKII